MVAQFSRGGQTKLVVYDARTLERGATWGPIDGSYTLGVVQGHTALLGNGALTEFSDSLGNLRSRPLAAAGAFLEDPQTGAIATARGEVFVHGEVACCSLAYAGALSSKAINAQTDPCLDDRVPTHFKAVDVISNGNVITLETIFDDPSGMRPPPKYFDDCTYSPDRTPAAPSSRLTAAARTGQAVGAA